MAPMCYYLQRYLINARALASLDKFICLPTLWPTYLPTYLLPTYLPTYIHTYLPTYLPNLWISFCRLKYYCPKANWAFDYKTDPDAPSFYFTKNINSVTITCNKFGWVWPLFLLVIRQQLSKSIPCSSFLVFYFAVSLGRKSKWFIL